MKKFILSGYYNWGGKHGYVDPIVFNSYEEAREEQVKLANLEADSRKAEQYSLFKSDLTPTVIFSKNGENNAYHMVWNIHEVEIDL